MKRSASASLAEDPADDSVLEDVDGDDDENQIEKEAFRKAGEQFRDLLVRLHVQKGLEAVHITGLAY